MKYTADLLTGITAFCACALFALAAALWWRRHMGVAFRPLLGFFRRPLFEVLVFLLVVGGFVQYAATKGTNGNDRASGPAQALRDAPEPDPDPPSSVGSPLRFTSIAVGSNSVSLALAWTTNFSPARASLTPTSGVSLPPTFKNLSKSNACNGCPVRSSK